MKRLAIVAFVLMSSSTLFAKHFGRSGCGLGSMLITGQDKASQVFSATTNGSSGNQTFGISSGTSNCMDHKAKTALMPFLRTNKVQVENEAAKGSGESLAGLNTIMGCNAEALNAHLKANYELIFVSEQSTQDLSHNIISSIRTDETLSASCQILM